MNNMDYVVNKVLKVLREDIKKKTNGYDGIGTVKRIDGDIAWVQLDKNNPTLTPVRISGAACKKEDVVRVRVSNGTAFIQGNDTHAPTDDSKANEADSKAVQALDAATEIRAIAEEAIQGNTENAENFAQAIMAVNSDIENLQEQIDGNITSWFYNVDPAMDRPPVTTDPADPDATGWDTDEKKNNHLGDLYYNVDSGKVWRFVFSNGAYSWSAVEDSDVTRALEIASRAQDTADSKRRVFVTTPVVPYDVGDLWVQGSGGDIMRCVQAKTSAGSYSASDWIKASKYTDDSALTTWINGEFATTIQELETGIADAKVETFYQSTNPATNWTAAQKQEHAGDLWYDTSANKYYRYNGSAWEEVKATPPQAVFDRIDGKATIFVGSTTPSNPQAGDLWLKSANDDILTYVNGNWVKYNKYTDNTRANEAYDRASAALTSANGKNKVYHQTSQPSGGTYISGDTWFDTDDGYKMYTYNGTSWVAEQFGNAAIADLSITNGKIANATIQSAKISGLDVGKLTGGYIDASHINAAEISIGQSQVTGLVADLASKADSSDVPTKVSDLTNDSGFQNATQVESAITSKGYQTAAQVSSAITSGISGKADKTATVTATVSVYYRSTSSTAPSKPTSSTTIGTSATTDNAWEYVMPQPKRDRYFYTCERYTYANGDIAYSTVRALASETYASKWVSSNDNTYIDGGRLYANSVTADKIVTSGITIAQSQVTDLTTALAGKANTSSVPTKVSQLTNDSSFATTGQVSTAKSEAISTASSDATTKANNAKTSAINTASADATSKANAAAQTATSYIQADSNGIKIAKTVGSATTYTWIDSTSYQVYKDGASISSFSDAIRLGKLSAENLYFTSANSEGTLAFRNGTSTTCAIIGDSDSGMMTLQTGNGANQVVMTTGSVDYATFNNGSATLNGTLSVAKKLTAGAINNSLFAVTSETFEYSTTYGAGNQEKTTSAVTKSGYYPLGVVGFNANQAGWVVRRCYLTDKGSGTCKVYFNIRNTTSTKYAITFTVHILWVKITA